MITMPIWLFIVILIASDFLVMALSAACSVAHDTDRCDGCDYKELKPPDMCEKCGNHYDGRA